MFPSFQTPPLPYLGNFSMITYCLPHAIMCEVLYPSLFFRKKLKNQVENNADKHTCVSCNETRLKLDWDGHYI